MANNTQLADLTPAKRKRIKPSLTTALVLGFGALIVIGMGSVQAITMWSAQKNTRELLADNARFAVVSLVRETRRRLAPVRTLNEYVTRLIDTGQIDLDDRETLGETLLLAMAGTDQVSGMAFFYPDGSAVRVARGRGMLPPEEPGGNPDIAPIMRIAKTKFQSFWGPPIWIKELDSTAITIQTPIREGDRFRGILTSVVTVNALSRFIARSGALPLAGNRFILYGKDHVLAHRSMERGKFERQSDIPLPPLDGVNDPILENLWNTENRRRLQIELDPNTKGHGALINEEMHIFVYRELLGFTDRPLIVGIYAGPEDGLGIEFRRLARAGIAGLVVIVLCVVIAIVLGRRISAPIRALAAGSTSIADLDFEHVVRLKSSRLRELDEAADAFNRMTTGLQWFETYVPQQLVRRLMARETPVESEHREITVMFTDIVGFSTLSEHMPAAETATMLNEHFAILVDCIEAEGGTVDKYIGDSVMAFWEPDENGVDVDRAIRAARQIRRRVTEDNIARRLEHRVAPCVRIGIHTGDAIVGNIGAPGRINYTLVGDAVNVAARLEQLSKTIGPENDAKILISDETAALAEDRDGLVHGGVHEIRGRDGSIEVWSLT
ncbi:MAG: adenylate cyclase [Paracoccaceae bacterium]|jgi:adenylate cyclase